MPWRYRLSNFPEVYTEKAFLFLVDCKRREFLQIADGKAPFYSKTRQAKKSGGFREIYRPDWRLKPLLKKVSRRFLSPLNFPNFVHCGPRGRSILTAVRGHSGYAHHLCLDIESFFDSVTREAVERALREIGVTKAVARTLVQISVENNKLPQGFPTSSLLSALVLSRSVEDFYEHHPKGKFLLSIYADDIMISSNEKEALRDARDFIISRLESVGLSTNADKEAHFNKGEPLTWLGLQIHPWVAVPRKSIRELEHQIYEFRTLGEIPTEYKPKKKGNPKQLWKMSMKGKLVFARSINPNKLIMKSMRFLREAKIRRS